MSTTLMTRPKPAQRGFIAGFDMMASIIIIAVGLAAVIGIIAVANNFVNTVNNTMS